MRTPGRNFHTLKCESSCVKRERKEREKKGEKERKNRKVVVGVIGLEPTT